MSHPQIVGSMVHNRFHGKITETRDNLDEPECGVEILFPTLEHSREHINGNITEAQKCEIQTLIRTLCQLLLKTIVTQTIKKRFAPFT